MDALLVVGIETVAGANIAAALAGKYRVTGLSTSAPVAIEGCETGLCPLNDWTAIREWMASAQPQWIVYCGAAARSAWDDPQPSLTEAESARAAKHWAVIATEFGCVLTFVSSDAVFSSPWMFHEEDSECFCRSRQAEHLRTLETQVGDVCSRSLVVRTNAFGWAPDAAGLGWIERLTAALEDGRAVAVDHVRHATPILATDLAEVLDDAYRAGLTGMVHVAGAERCNPAQFVLRLADQFGLPAPHTATRASLGKRPTEFGLGETSLRTAKIRQALGRPMPMLSDGLARLHQQRLEGFADRLNMSRPVQEKVA